MAKKPQYRKPTRPVKPATPDSGEERVLTGNRVVVEFLPNDLTRGRIPFRHR